MDKDNIAIANTGIDHAVPLAAQGKIGVASDGSGDIVFDIFFRENGNPAGDAAHQRDHILLVAGIIPPHQLRGSDSENFRQRFNNGNGKLFDFMAFIAIERCTGNAQLIGNVFDVKPQLNTALLDFFIHIHFHTGFHCVFLCNKFHLNCFVRLFYHTFRENATLKFVNKF